jgi:hypothetical protein
MNNIAEANRRRRPNSFDAAGIGDTTHGGERVHVDSP